MTITLKIDSIFKNISIGFGQFEFHIGEIIDQIKNVFFHCTEQINKNYIC